MENNKKNYPDHVYGLCGYDKGKLYLEWIGEGKEILDLGCGSGIFSQFYSKNNKITGVDFDDKNKNSFIEKTKGFFLEQPEKIDITRPHHIYYFSFQRLKKLLKKFFPEIKIVSFSRVKILKDIFPFLFSSTLGFKCKKQ